MKCIDVGGMCEGVYGLDTFHRIKEEQLGHYAVLFAGKWSLGKLREAVAYCKKNNIRFVMDEMWVRTQPLPKPIFENLDKQVFHDLIEEAGDLYDGTLFMCEYGGVAAYWPVSSVEGSPNVIPATDCAEEAKGYMVAKLREIIDQATSWMVKRPLILIEASPMAKYLYESGIDRVDLEVTYNRFTEVGYAATRGATRAYEKERFGVDMAMVWYGGNQHDALWLHRWKVSLYHAFLRGADPIYAEHGLMDYKARGKSCKTDDPEVKIFRDELAGFADFCRRHPRPEGFPKTRLAVFHGNLDSFSECTIGQPYVWGQRSPEKIPAGYPEQSWELFFSLYQDRSWEFPFAAGDRDLSGNPPWGQVDAIPAESDLSVWQQYDAVMFLGWNTMTPEIYRTMDAYVAGGGHLLASLAHLDTRTRRTDPVCLVQNGDLRDVFGVHVTGLDARVAEGIKFKQQPSCGEYSFPTWGDTGDPMYQHGGFPCAQLDLTTAELIAAESDRFGDTWARMDGSPVLTANAHGKGMALLLNALEYPGHPGLRQLYTDLLFFFTAAHQGALQVEASDCVRYGTFTEDDMHILYALNTDPGLQQEIRITFGNNERIPFSIPPGEMTALYLTPSLMVHPHNIADRIVAMEKQGDVIRLQFYAGESISERSGSQSGIRDVFCHVDGQPWNGSIEIAEG